MQRLKLCFYLDIRTGPLHNGHDECEAPQVETGKGTLKVRKEHVGVIYILCISRILIKYD